MFCRIELIFGRLTFLDMKHILYNICKKLSLLDPAKRKMSQKAIYALFALKTSITMKMELVLQHKSGKCYCDNCMYQCNNPCTILLCCSLLNSTLTVLFKCRTNWNSLLPLQLKEVIEKLHPLVKMARAGQVPKQVLEALCDKLITNRLLGIASFRLHVRDKLICLLNLGSRLPWTEAPALPQVRLWNSHEEHQMLCCDFKFIVLVAYQSYDQRQTAWVGVELVLLDSGSGLGCF